jgi:hypothetical protein
LVIMARVWWAGDLEIVRNKRQITVGKAFPS